MKVRKPFNAAVRQLLEEQAAAGPPPQPSSNEERVRMARGYMARLVEGRTSIAGLPNSVEGRDVAITPGLAGRLYVPRGLQKAPPIVVYLHGGGWVVGSVRIFAPFCCLLSEQAQVMVLSVEYRLAPEHPYPAGLEDAVTAIRWTAHHAGELGANPARVAVAGDSAGANLAAAAMNRLRAAGEVETLCAALLLYPVTDHPSAGHPSYEQNAKGFGMDAALMHWFWEQYAGHVSPSDPSVSLLQLKDIPALPPTLVATAEYDVLRDEGIAYAEKLKRAGVPVTHFHAEDMGHNFPVTPNLIGRFPECVAELDRIAMWLKATCSAAEPGSMR